VAVVRTSCLVGILSSWRVGDPMQPPVSINAWKTSVEKLIRENVPVTYRFWKGKKHE
jgi:hypothetical protein